MIKDKKIIFFDGDGTLWYPKKTKRTIVPHWIYKITGRNDAHLKELILTPGTLQSLKKIKKNKIITIILSTHPEAGNLADEFLKKNVKYLGIYEYFDEIHTTDPEHKSKGEFIIKILKKRGLAKNKALMIGDNYFYDYCSAKKVGVEAILIDSDYLYKSARKKTNRIVSDLRNIINFSRL